MEQLISNETLIKTVNVGTEKFTVTNKRLLYSNNGTSDIFVGVKELRGAEIKETEVKFNRFNLPPFQSLGAIIGVVTIVSSYIYYCTTKSEFQFGDLTPVFLGAFWCLGTVPVIALVIYLIQSFTSYKVNRTIFNIVKKDNTYWCNQNYDPSFTKDLKDLESQINSVIYSSEF